MRLSLTYSGIIHWSSAIKFTKVSSSYASNHPFFQMVSSSEWGVTTMGYILSSSGLKSGFSKTSHIHRLSVSGFEPRRLGIIWATTLNPASLRSRVAREDSLFPCHRLLSSLIVSSVVWYPISTRVTPYFRRRIVSSTLTQSGRVSMAIPITRDSAVSFRFFASSRFSEAFIVNHFSILKRAKTSSPVSTEARNGRSSL